VKRSLTFRPIARCSANLMWWDLNASLRVRNHALTRARSHEAAAGAARSRCSVRQTISPLPHGDPLHPHLADAVVVPETVAALRRRAGAGGGLFTGDGDACPAVEGAWAAVEVDGGWFTGGCGPRPEGPPRRRKPHIISPGAIAFRLISRERKSPARFR
jgi:hypothetical protein